MFKFTFAILGSLVSCCSFAQTNTSSLTVEKIMRDPSWMGTSPSNVFWGKDGKTIYFSWNPEKATSDSLYSVQLENTNPKKLSPTEKLQIVDAGDLIYNQQQTAYIYEKDNDIFYYQIKTKVLKQITNTIDSENNPVFSFNDSKIVYSRNQNLYAWDIQTGETLQLTNTKNERSGSSGRPQLSGSNDQEKWLTNDQLQFFNVLRERKEKKDAREEYIKDHSPKVLRSISIDNKNLQGLSISSDGNFISYILSSPAGGMRTIVPNYITENGFTTDITTRTKVGQPQGTSELFVYDRRRDSVYKINIDSIPGIKDIPTFVKDYPEQLKEKEKKLSNRTVRFSGMSWSPSSQYAVVNIFANDNKDRWIMLLDTATKSLQLLDRQHDEAWISGPGINGFNTGWINDKTFWFQSEKTGYSHLYSINVVSKKQMALTNGNYEVQRAKLSNNKKQFFISTNEVHPGEQQFYVLDIASGKKERITSKTGANTVSISPDEKKIAYLYSYSNKPWELFIQDNKPGATAIQITDKAQSEEFKSYPWREPELISFTASDGITVYGRLYKPANPHPNKPAVLFVHGAGYLQNAHKWWSSYFREYMFNHLLADNGYTVLDIDYRASAGYGRDFRTGIYRHMGGKDLSDHVDAVNYLVKNHGVNPKNVGLYGGSYGGFITLMGLFTDPDVFKSGAALRPVTDWANYNHGYTSNILNEPFTDSIAYRKSSPIYFAEGLKGTLLICHGMVDVNVHYQDVVKLSQKLIELGKDNWELASYPMEDHGFVEPSSWTDEYKRIFKLFESTLKK